MYEDYAEANKCMAKKLQTQLKGAYTVRSTNFRLIPKQEITQLVYLQNLQKWYVEERRDLDEQKYGGIRRMSKEGK